MLDDWRDNNLYGNSPPQDATSYLTPRTTTPRGTGGTNSATREGVLLSKRILELKNEIRVLEEASKRKEYALIGFNERVERLQDELSTMRMEIDAKNNQIKKMSVENKALSDIVGQQQYTIKMLERDLQESENRRGLMSRGGNAREMKIKEKEIEDLKAANDFLLTTVERYDKALMNLNEIAKLSFGGSGSLVSQTELQAKIKAQLSNLIDLKDTTKPGMNGLVNSMLPPGGGFQQQQQQQPAVFTRSGVLYPAGDDGKSSMLDMGDPLGAKTWMEEKRVYLAEIRRLNETVGSQEKTIRAQHSRLLQLTDRIEFIGETLKELKNRGYSGMSIAAAASSYGADGSAIANAMEIVSGGANGGGGGGMGDEHSTKIPIAVAEFLEKEIVQLREELKYRELTLQEKVDALELLERKVDVLSHARDTEAKKSARKIKTLQQEVDELKSHAYSLHVGNQQQQQQQPKKSIDTSRMRKR